MKKWCKHIRYYPMLGYCYSWVKNQEVGYLIVHKNKCRYCGKPRPSKGAGGEINQTKGIKMSKAVLVTTEYRAVFFGHVKDDKNLPNEIILKKARNCIYWTAECNGFLGLATKGPISGCKIGVEVPELRIWKITSVTPVSDEAAEKWSKA